MCRQNCSILLIQYISFSFLNSIYFIYLTHSRVPGAWNPGAGTRSPGSVLSPGGDAEGMGRVEGRNIKQIMLENKTKHPGTCWARGRGYGSGSLCSWQVKRGSEHLLYPAPWAPVAEPVPSLRGHLFPGSPGSREAPEPC